jgi:DNA-binding MarR family transcriptional regulator
MDQVAAIAEQWRTQRPDLDPGPLLVLGRIQRIEALADTVLRAPFAAAGLGNGDFDALAALRRAGPPFALSPGALADAMLVTTGAVTKRVDRLLERGLVTRAAAGGDGRARVVGLTPAGLRLTDRLIAEHLDNERDLLGGLSAAETGQLADLLGRLLADLERR